MHMLTLHPRRIVVLPRIYKVFHVSVSHRRGGGKYRMIGFRKGFQRFRAPPEFMLTFIFRQNVVFPMLFDAF